jgi:hypothetical protein
MPSIRLNPADREKYGTEEWIDIDYQAIGLRQRAAAEKATKRSLRWMFDQLQGVPELDDDGNAIPVRDPATGELVLVNGQPVPRLITDPEALAMVVWMALWGVGIKVPWDDFDVTGNGLEFKRLDIEVEDEDEDDSGKDQEPETDSESSTTT